MVLVIHWQNVRLSKDGSRTQQLFTCSKHASITITASPLSLYPHPHTTPMAPNKFFHNLEQTIKVPIQFVPCPVCDKQLKRNGGLAKHMSSAHADYQGHFSSQFVYKTNEINKDEDCYYADDYADNDDSSTNNNNNPPSPSHVAPSAFPLPPD